MNEDQLQKLQDLFEDKYGRLLDMSYQDWLATAPQNEAEAYAKLDELNDEIERISDAKEEAVDESRDSTADKLDALRTEYALIEELFGLESKDADW